MNSLSLTGSQERILDAATQVFAANGYRGGSLNDVAKLSGYTRAGLLHHYPSKQAMLLALLDLRDERLSSEEPLVEEGSSEAVAWGRAAGTPEHQLDWGE